MNDLVHHESDQFRRAMVAPAGSAANVGAITIESERAVAEARGQIQLAKMFPRSVTGAITEFLDACRSPDFAATAFYAVPNRGSGPSIRFAEEAARCYGNFEYGHRELSRSDGKSEVEVYAWDKEKNNRSPRQITVMHIVDTKNGPKPCRDQADIDNRIANVASKQIRGRILALLPKHMIAAGIAECQKTLAGGGEKPLSVRIQGVVQAFSKYGVNIKRLEAHLGHGIDDTTVEELADLVGIGNALKEGASVAEYFPIGGDQAEDAGAVKAIADAATAGKNKAAAAATTTTRASRQANKPAEAQVNPVKDPAQNVTEKAQETGGDSAAPEQLQQQEVSQPAATQAAGMDDDVF
jgi:hypothetical protein